MPKILVIDDEIEIREILTKAFSIQGHQVTTAIDGQDGLDVVREIVPDLILLDLTMPRMDGYQVLEVLKSDTTLRNIPVIILTALSNKAEVIKGLEQGANDYIGKPFSLQELLARTAVQFRIQELEQKIRESEAYHRALFERTSDPVLVIGPTGQILQVNEAATKLLDIGSDQLLNQRIHNLVDLSERREFEVAFSGALEGIDIPIFEVQLNLPNNRILPVDADLGSVDIQGQRRLLLHLRDIRRRKSAEAQSSMIFEHIGDGVFITDQRGIILMASRSAIPLTGYPRDEIVGLDVAQFLDPESLARWESYRGGQTDRVQVYEAQFHQKTKREIPVEWTLATFSVGSEIYFIGVVRDLTERKVADDRRRESEQLQTLLEIAGGAAHEINQPLTAILGYAEMSQGLLDPSHPVSEYQQHILEATDRISETLKKMQEIREYRTRPYTYGHRIVDFTGPPQKEGEEPL